MGSAAWDGEHQTSLRLDPALTTQQTTVSINHRSAFTAVPMELKGQLLTTASQQALQLVARRVQQILVPTPGPLNSHQPTPAVIKSKLPRARVIAV